MADQKHRLRKVMRKCRAALSSERALALSRSVQTRAIALDCYRHAAAVLLYAAVNNEVATTLILEHALAAGRRVFYPVADVAVRQAGFPRRRRARRSAARTFWYSRAADGPCDRSRGELRGAMVFVPVLAFGAGGERLGMGGGYYDRFLASTGPGGDRGGAGLFVPAVGTCAPGSVGSAAGLRGNRARRF